LLDRRGFLKVTMATLGAMLVVPLTALAQTKPLPQTKPNEIMPENPSTYIPPQGAEGPTTLWCRNVLQTDMSDNNSRWTDAGSMMFRRGKRSGHWKKVGR
jgi:hypothetical protein